MMIIFEVIIYILIVLIVGAIVYYRLSKIRSRTKEELKESSPVGFVPEEASVRSRMSWAMWETMYREAVRGYDVTTNISRWDVIKKFPILIFLFGLFFSLSGVVWTLFEKLGDVPPGTNPLIYLFFNLTGLLPVILFIFSIQKHMGDQVELIKTLRKNFGSRALTYILILVPVALIFTVAFHLEGVRVFMAVFGSLILALSLSIWYGVIFQPRLIPILNILTVMFVHGFWLLPPGYNTKKSP
jgi:hypothetical protein